VIKGSILADPRDTESIMCACLGVWRMSVVTPNSDVESNSKYDLAKRREPTELRHSAQVVVCLGCTVIRLLITGCGPRAINSNETFVTSNLYSLLLVR
jgi:hypothetical protein